jgi:hypothetical protein
MPEIMGQPPRGDKDQYPSNYDMAAERGLLTRCAAGSHRLLIKDCASTTSTIIPTYRVPPAVPQCTEQWAKLGSAQTRR